MEETNDLVLHENNELVIKILIDENVVVKFLISTLPSSLMMLSDALLAGIKVYNGEIYQGQYIGLYTSTTLVGIIGHFWNGVVLFSFNNNSDIIISNKELFFLALPHLLKYTSRKLKGIIGNYSLFVDIEDHLVSNEYNYSISYQSDLFFLILEKNELIFPSKMLRMKINNIDNNQNNNELVLLKLHYENNIEDTYLLLLLKHVCYLYYLLLLEIYNYDNNDTELFDEAIETALGNYRKGCVYLLVKQDNNDNNDIYMNDEFDRIFFSKFKDRKDISLNINNKVPYDKIVSMCFVSCRAANYIQVNAVYTPSKYRGNKYSATLINNIILHESNNIDNMKCLLFVSSDNFSAIKIYTKYLGFKFLENWKMVFLKSSFN